MNERAEDRITRQPESPVGKVIGAVEPEEIERVTVALISARFSPDEVDVVDAKELQAIEGPFERDGVRGFIERFLLSLGEELNALDELRRMAADGHTLIGVPVDGDESMRLAATVVRDHGAHEVTHFGRWTITTL